MCEGIKIDPGYPAFDRGLQDGIFVRRPDNHQPYQGIVSAEGLALLICSRANQICLRSCPPKPGPRRGSPSMAYPLAPALLSIPERHA